MTVEYIGNIICSFYSDANCYVRYTYVSINYILGHLYSLVAVEMHTKHTHYRYSVPTVFTVPNRTTIYPVCSLSLLFFFYYLPWSHRLLSNLVFLALIVDYRIGRFLCCYFGSLVAYFGYRHKESKSSKSSIPIPTTHSSTFNTRPLSLPPLITILKE